jgi:hypothetical protein
MAAAGPVKNEHVIYLGYTPDGSQTVASNLRDKGIELIRAPPGSVRVVCSDPPQDSHYYIFVNHLPLFGLSTKEDKVIQLNQMVELSDNSRNGVHLPFSVPPTAISFSGPLSDDVTEFLVARGFFRSGVNDSWICQKPTYAILKEVSNIGSIIKTTRVTHGYTNLNSIVGYRMACTILQNIAFILHYPEGDFTISKMRFKRGRGNDMNAPDEEADEEVEIKEGEDGEEQVSVDDLMKWR